MVWLLVTSTSERFEYGYAALAMSLMQKLGCQNALPPPAVMPQADPRWSTWRRSMDSTPNPTHLKHCGDGHVEGIKARDDHSWPPTVHVEANDGKHHQEEGQQGTDRGKG